MNSLSVTWNQYAFSLYFSIKRADREKRKTQVPQLSIAIGTREVAGLGEAGTFVNAKRCLPGLFAASPRHTQETDQEAVPLPEAA